MGFVSSTELVLALLSIVFYKFAAWLWRIKTSGLPPGPAPLPLIGNMLHVFRGGMNNVHITLAKLAEDYGEMFTFYLGSRPMVVLNTYDVMRDAFITHGRSFSGRNQSAVMKVVGKRGGIANAEGNLWKQHRKFAQFHLNQLGFGKSSFESKIHEEVSCLLRALEEKQGEPFDMQVLMSPRPTRDRERPESDRERHFAAKMADDDDVPVELLPQDESFRFLTSTPSKRRTSACDKGLCVTCGASFSKKSTLLDHMATKHCDRTATKTFTCPVTDCGKVFVRQTKFQDHMSQHANYKAFSCASCGKKFFNRYKKSQHEALCSGDKTIQCHACNQRFTEKVSLKRHIASQHEVTAFCCECGKSYKHYASLCRHKKQKLH